MRIARSTHTGGQPRRIVRPQRVTGGGQRTADTAMQETRATSRALVPASVDAAPSPRDVLHPLRHAPERACAPFLTQLIATSLDLEATRARRRAAPPVALAAYDETRARPAAQKPATFRRSL